MNRDAGEGDAEGSEPEPDEVIVWHRPVDFMGGKSRIFCIEIVEEKGRLSTLKCTCISVLSESYWKHVLI